MFPTPSEALPLKPIPGSYGLPLFGAIKDRLDYFYNQGKDEFFSTRAKKYQSTVFKTNMPPGPFIAQNPKVIAVLDAISFPVLFDTSKIEKFDVLDGTYLPSLSFTGGHRVCAYLDPSEPNHTSLKSFFMSVLASKHNDFIPLFRTCLSQMFVDIDDEMGSKKTASFNDPNKWLGLQLAPLATLGFPKFLKHFEDLLIHTFPIPFFPVKSDYKKLYDAFYASSGSVLDKAESLGIDRDEACHNLWVGQAGEKLHSQLANEIRSVVKEEGGVSFQALEKMTLTKSVVYEALRIEPGVPFQYGKAKEDIVINSHDAAYEIKKGEMIFGYQPFATKDPKIFDHAEEFVGHRFVGEGENLLKYVYWSNGRETEDPTVGNKQCPGEGSSGALVQAIVGGSFPTI
ncbi:HYDROPEROXIDE LYASE [Salix koriyanagi]|uniref:HYDROPEROXIDE LYASE n=1 Tax=Salix koriyanagi TaxID=2511006 RepID=A0A9Q0V0J7_9ROSI|nr:HYDROPEROXIDE LYASE [Salix koriyanagi]